MQHNKKTSIKPIFTSSSKFGVEYENQFVVLDDGKHIIRVDGSNLTKLIIENVENRKADKFGWNDSSFNYITTLVYDETTGCLYTGDCNFHLYKYKIDTTNKTCQRVKDYGDLGIDRMTSSHRFLHFVFFGGDRGRIRVLDLSTGKLLLGSLETSIWHIYSLQVCVKKIDQIYLAVSGRYPNYSDDKTDIFDVRGLFTNNQVTLQNYLSKNSMDEIDTLEQTSTSKFQKDKTQKLKQVRDF